MLWAASIDGHLSSLVACHCTYLYMFNLFVYLANKLSLSLSISSGPPHRAHNNTTTIQYETKTHKIHTDKHK